MNTLWPLFGISNQMLAAIALILATVVLFRMKRERYAWVTILPTVWLLACTLTAGVLKLGSADPRIGFLAHAAKFEAGVARGTLLAPAKSIADMRAIVLNDRIDAALTLLFMLVLLSILLFGIRACLAALASEHPTTHELSGNEAAA